LTYCTGMPPNGLDPYVNRVKGRGEGGLHGSTHPNLPPAPLSTAPHNTSTGSMTVTRYNHSRPASYTCQLPRVVGPPEPAMGSHGTGGQQQVWARNHSQQPFRAHQHTANRSTNSGCNTHSVTSRAPVHPAHLPYPTLHLRSSSLALSCTPTPTAPPTHSAPGAASKNSLPPTPLHSAPRPAPAFSLPTPLLFLTDTPFLLVHDSLPSCTIPQHSHPSIQHKQHKLTSPAYSTRKLPCPCNTTPSPPCAPPPPPPAP
jgi:hypothetical protein